jgi:hypothetical protein
MVAGATSKIGSIGTTEPADLEDDEDEAAAAAAAPAPAADRFWRMEKRAERNEIT